MGNKVKVYDIERCMSKKDLSDKKILVNNIKLLRDNLISSDMILQMKNEEVRNNE